jgi:hypothetical protein
MQFDALRKREYGFAFGEDGRIMVLQNLNNDQVENSMEEAKPQSRFQQRRAGNPATTPPPIAGRKRPGDRRHALVATLRKVEGK